MRLCVFRRRTRAQITSGVLVAAVVLTAAAAAPHAARGAAASGGAYGGRNIVPGEVIVGFRAGVSARERAAVLAAAGVHAPRKFHGLNAVAARTAHPGRSIARLERDPSVRYAEPNYILTVDDVTPNDPSFGQQWGLDNIGQVVNFLAGTPGADIHAKQAWSVTTGSAGNTVAVIDSGVELSHPDLAANVWTNPGENCAGCQTDGIDNDNNGYVDDWRGWDFLNNDNNPTDDNGHGTHVAGTIGAVGNNGIGVTGVNWSVRLMALKFIGADGSGTTEDAVLAIEYAVENGAAVLNNSYGGTDFSQALSDAIGDAEARNSLFVAAAGNSATDNDVTPTYPASDPHANVLSVAATTNRDQQAWFSNYGRTSVDLGAPGDGIYSTWIGGSYAAASGTSMAAPHVAGGAALARAVLPPATAVGLKALLLSTADPNAALAGRTRTGARLDVDGAVRCTGAQVWIEQPASGFVAALGDTVQISAIGASCGNPGGASVTATVNGETIGLTPRGDGLYTGSYKATAPGPIAITVSASSPGGSDSLTVSGQVPTPIVPGGAPVTVSVGNPDETRLLEFPGTAGKRVSVNLTGVTMSLVSVRLLKPDATTLGSSALVGTPGGFMDVRTLPVTGQYTLLVDPQGTATGSITLTLYDVPADVGASTTVGGPPVTVATTVPGQNAAITFAGSAGQRVSMKFTGVTMGSPIVRLLKPDGTAVGSSVSVGSPEGFVDTRTLPVAAVYSIGVDPKAAATGSATLTLYNVPADVTASASPGGPPVTIATTVPGQNAAVTFSGSAGQRLSVKVSGVTMSSAMVTVLKPDGTALGASVVAGASGSFLDVRTLPVAGVYTLVVDPLSATTGSITLTLYDVPADVSVPASPGGPPVTIATTVPGQNAAVTFSGAAGQRVSVKLSGVTMSLATVSVLKPDGTPLGSNVVVGTAGGFVDVRTLPVAGGYTLVVDPQGTVTGSITLTLYDVPPDVSASASPGGPSVTVSTTVPGQNASVTFSGTAGQSISLQLTGVTIASSLVSVKAPDGSNVVSPTLVLGTGRTFAFVLPSAGTYTIVVDPQAANVGNMTVRVT